MVAFGKGHDIKISSNCNFNSESYTNMGHTYQLPAGVFVNSEEAKSYLGGAFNFKVIEIEVYRVVFPSN